MSIGLREKNGRITRIHTESWTPEKWDEGWVDRRRKFHVYLPEHPKSSDTGWVFRSWAVWWLKMGETITHPQALHHKNHNPLDDRLENLQVMTAGEHTSHHSKKSPVECLCETCNMIFGLPQWRINQGRGRWCSVGCARRSPENRKRQSKVGKQSCDKRWGKK